MLKIQPPLIYFKITDEMSEWIYSVCLWSIKPAKFDHDPYDQCKKSNLINYQSIKGLLVLSVKRHSSTTDNFDYKKAAE